MEIITERLCLRDVEEKDYDFFSEMEENEECLKFEAEEKPSKEAIDKKFAETLKDKDIVPRTRFRLLVTDLQTDKAIGKIVLWKIDDSINEWEMGWEIHPEFWGKGYAPEASRALLEYAFNHLLAHRVQDLCNDHNHASERVMIKIGMIKEGTLRGVRKLKGCWYGSHIYSLLDSEFTK